MSKININKINDLDSIRSIRATSDATRTEKTKINSTDRRSGAESDNFKLSERATEVGKLVDQLKALPAVRSEKVESLREQIAADNYDPSSDSIAEAILSEE